VEIKFRDAESRKKAMDELQKTSPDLLLKEVDEVPTSSWWPL